MSNISRKVGRPRSLPARLIIALNCNGGICKSKFALGTLAGADQKETRLYIDRFAQLGIVNISQGPRGAHIITLSKRNKRNLKK